MNKIKKKIKEREKKRKFIILTQNYEEKQHILIYQIYYYK